MAMQYSVEAILSARDSNFTSTMDNAQKLLLILAKKFLKVLHPIHSAQVLKKPGAVQLTLMRE